MATEVPTPAPGSIRALIAELAQLEDAVRRTKTFASVSNAGADPVLNPQLVVLFKRQAEIVAALRRAANKDTPSG